MPVREILLLGNPELWRPSSPVVDVHARETRDLIGDLAATLDDTVWEHALESALRMARVGVDELFAVVGCQERTNLANLGVGCA